MDLRVGLDGNEYLLRLVFEHGGSYGWLCALVKIVGHPRKLYGGELKVDVADGQIVGFRDTENPYLVLRPPMQIRDVFGAGETVELTEPQKEPEPDELLPGGHRMWMVDRMPPHLWRPIFTAPEGEVIDTRIWDPEHGEQERRLLVRKSEFFLPGRSEPVSYTPTSWKPVKDEGK